jgi:hypothetical protein
MNAYNAYITLMNTCSRYAQEYLRDAMGCMDHDLVNYIQDVVLGHEKCTAAYFLKLYCQLHREKYGVNFSV